MRSVRSLRALSNQSSIIVGMEQGGMCRSWRSSLSVVQSVSFQLGFLKGARSDEGRAREIAMSLWSEPEALERGSYFLTRVEALWLAKARSMTLWRLSWSEESLLWISGVLSKEKP